MKQKIYVLGEFGSVYVSWFTDLYDAAVFEPILCHFRKFHLCQISEKVICPSKSLHKIENLRLS